MANKKKQNSGCSGVMLYAKAPGRTSFSSLSTIKKALETSKVGHTGTLDSFADGLLVVLVGSLTRLVPHITGFDKTYLALVEFGRETDTLDPTGTVIKTAPLPTEGELRAVLPRFTGGIMQVPPAFSALHVDGKRAHELMRSGESVTLPARPIHIYAINLLDFAGSYALLEVHCSKGTYIRSLARDIGAACGSCAHVRALRRTSVGPFSLKDAAGSELLGDFTISALTAGAELPADASADGAVAGAVSASGAATDSLPPTGALPASSLAEPDYARVRAALQPMTPALARYCGFVPVLLSESGLQAFANGRPLKRNHFYLPSDFDESAATAQLAAFAADGSFSGIVEQHDSRLSYGFVIPQKPAFTVFSWEQVTSGRFNAAWREQGTALTIGSFDGPHFGHESLFATVAAQKQLVSGVITFSRSLRGLKDPAHYAGDLATLSQRLAAFQRKGFSFAVVIDFTPEFARLSGAEFLSQLCQKCGMKFLSEGNDFHLGYRGATDVPALMEISKSQGFDVAAIAPVQCAGEKISSSRIRQAVLAGDFASAAAMLNHPFTLDCAGWLWLKAADGSLGAKARKGQLLPRGGSYPVTLRLFSPDSSGLFCTEKAVCTVTADGVLLAPAAQGLSGTVLAISFCPVQ